MRIFNSSFDENRAVEGGGALYVEGGAIEIFNRTSFTRNAAPRGTGSSVSLLAGRIRYTLPAPAGRWLFVPMGETLEVDDGSIDADWPFECSAGLVGGSSPHEQRGPQCNRPCPAAHFCPAVTTEPIGCAQGTFCPQAWTSMSQVPIVWCLRHFWWYYLLLTTDY